MFDILRCMNLTVALVATYLFALGSLGVAGWLVTHELKGWGWFLLVGVICAASVKYSDSKCKCDEDKDGEG